jgi:hypothetical protein
MNKKALTEADTVPALMVEPVKVAAHNACREVERGIVK